MAVGQRRSWNQVPLDSNVSPAMADFHNWVLASLQDLQGPDTPIQAPQVTTVSHPGAVLVAWNELPKITSYAVYETSSATAPAGVPFAIVPANVNAISGAILRSGLNDTTVRYYSVQAISQFRRGQLSKPVAGAALSTAATVIPVSQKPLNSNGVGGGVGGGGGLYPGGQI